MIFNSLFEIKIIKGMGRGIFTKKNIPKGQVIHVAEVIEFNRKNSSKIRNTSLNYYVYDLGHGKLGLALGFGSLFNHQHGISCLQIKQKGDRK